MNGRSYLLNASKGSGLSVFRVTGFVIVSGGGGFLFLRFWLGFLRCFWSLSAFGGCILVVSGVLFVLIP
jgi:hypothetical protein